ncbi:MAG: hypothetical protein NTU98_01165 [Bacteroidetes bacterium]|nr:hypothetical protein [Bacteroidota bacterium]
MQTRLPGLFLFIAAITIMVSCKKEKSEQEVSSTLMTVHLTDHYVYNPFKAVVFISGPDGSVLSDTTITSDGTYILNGKSGTTAPAAMSVTFVNYELYWHGVKVHINTYTGVTPGSEWTIRGSKPDTVGRIMVTFTNLPNPPPEILYSTSGYSNVTYNPVNQTSFLYKSPDSLYIRVRNITGDRYKIVGNVLAGGTYTIDMSDALPVATQTISLPFPAQNYQADIFGYPGGDLLTQTPVMTDMLISNGIAANAMTVDFPPQTFGGFRTNLMLQETFNSVLTYYDRTEGDLPSAFTQSSATIGTMTPGNGSVQFDATGAFSMSTSAWSYTGPSYQFFDWNLYSNETDRNVRLPQLSPALNRLFPELIIDSLAFQSVELTSFNPAGSYQDFLNHSFVMPASQRQAMHVEAISVRKEIAR